jgi:ABC-type nitrate/sulfonate/bicarbonate transport system substrate-binding protein
MRLLLRLGVSAIAAVALGCGSSGHPPRVTSAALVLDFTPNAVHAGIYSALARGFDRQEGVRLRVVAPSASTDSSKLLETGKANFAILDIHDLAIARERGQDIVGIMAIVERPLAAVIAAPGIHNPRQLQGRLVGITGVPSDTAVLRSIVGGAGGDPRRLRTVTIGFNAVADLLAARIAAATAFWNDEGVALARSRPGFTAFRVDRYGAPSYPELVLCAARRTVVRSRGLAQAVVRALVRGYAATVRDPRRSAAELESRVAGLDPSLTLAQLAAVVSAFADSGGAAGELDRSVLDAWARWEKRFGIVRRAPDVATMFDPSFAAAAQSVSH